MSNADIYDQSILDAPNNIAISVYRISITCEIFFPMGAMSIFTVLLMVEHKPLIRFDFYIPRTNCNYCMVFAISQNFHAIYLDYIFFRNSEFEVINCAPTIRSLSYRIRNP